VFVLRVLYSKEQKAKKKSQDSKYKERSTDKLQRDNKRRQKDPAVGMDVGVLCCK
jgi:hypothetical protein